MACYIDQRATILGRMEDPFPQKKSENRVFFAKFLLYLLSNTLIFFCPDFYVNSSVHPDTIHISTTLLSHSTFCASLYVRSVRDKETLVGKY